MFRKSSTLTEVNEMAWTLIDGNNTIARDTNPMTFMVGSEADLATGPEYTVPIGSVAYTADLEHIWQMDQNGNWVAVVGGE